MEPFAGRKQTGIQRSLLLGRPEVKDLLLLPGERHKVFLFFLFVVMHKDYCLHYGLLFELAEDF